MKMEKCGISANVLFPAIEVLLAEGRQAAFTVTGMSMWPLLCHGRDQVVVEAWGNYLLHRITKKTNSGVVTTGDGNCFRDGEFSFSRIRAKVVSLVRNGKVIKCSGWKWKVMSQIWMALFPARKLIFAVWFRIRKYVRN